MSLTHRPPVLIKNGKQVLPTVDIGPFGDFDEIQASYPSGTTEVYTYRLNAVSIGTVTVTYSNNSKNELVSVVYNAL
jgi:hypothetical protein